MHLRFKFVSMHLKYKEYTNKIKNKYLMTTLQMLGVNYLQQKQKKTSANLRKLAARITTYRAQNLL